MKRSLEYYPFLPYFFWKVFSVFENVIDGDCLICKMNEAVFNSPTVFPDKIHYFFFIHFLERVSVLTTIETPPY